VALTNNDALHEEIQKEREAKQKLLDTMMELQEQKEQLSAEVQRIGFMPLKPYRTPCTYSVGD